MKESLVFVGAKRTPFGANGGSLKDVSPTQLGVHSAKAALAQSGVRPDQIEHLIYGNVLHSAPDSIYSPRHIGLHSGVPIEVPALGLNRLCGSGFQAIVDAYQQMCAGDTEVALVGGIENMSMAPYAVRGARWGLRMGNHEFVDTMVEALTDRYAGAPMAITAENLAEMYKITREDSDTFALRSQTLTKKAIEAGAYKDEIAPYAITDKKGNTVELAHDEHPRPQTTMEALAKLKPVFKKDGIVTAGVSSGIVDGACSLVVATEKRATAEKWKVLGRMVAYGVVGCEPKIMGIGPAGATRMALKRAGMKLEQMDLVEVNEAFAPQTIAVERELGINRDVLNVDGGAIAVGHPLAASGARIVTHLLYALKQRGKRYGLGTACIGGGQGIAIIVEAL
ncbi:MAG: acetyl-CoA C-acyltransferase [Bdellovibrionales bacterium]|nr:acetyl-CoA C-acyltransferase [Bdellovibrionales bacterium]